MEREHTLTIIQLIRATDLAVIQFKGSHIYILHIPTIPHNEWRFKKLTHKETGSIVKGTLEKKLHQDR